MRIAILSLTAALLGAAFTSAVPLQPRQDTLLPFEVTYVGSSNPPGVSGAHPWRQITADFTDPNQYPFFKAGFNFSIPAGLQGIHCKAEWFRGESPEGRTWPCDQVGQGHFVMQVLSGAKGPADVKDFKLKLIHGVEPGFAFPQVLDRVEAEAGPFTYPDNLGGGGTQGPCLKSGWCSYSASNTPFLAPARKII